MPGTVLGPWGKSVSKASKGSSPPKGRVLVAAVK